MADATPWTRLLAVSQTIGVAPADFWKLSLKEWRALVSPAHETLTRNAFNMLASRFPDKVR